MPTLLAACAGGHDDASEVSTGALSAGDDQVAASPSSAKPVPPASAPLASNDGSLKVAEVVLVHDADPTATGATPRARLIVSNQPDICSVLADGLNLRAGEKAVALWVDEAALSTGEHELGGDAQATGGCALYDETVMCAASAAPPLNAGAGTLTVTSAGDAPAGTIDVSFGSFRLTGTFTAKSCAQGRTTAGAAKCPADLEP